VQYVGALLPASCILAKTKLELYKNLHELQQHFKQVDVIVADTDGYIVEIKDPENKLLQYFKDNSCKYDLSQIDSGLSIYSLDNRNTHGVFRLVDLDIVSVVTLRPKCYCILKKCKCGNQLDFICHCQYNSKNSGVGKEGMKRLSYEHYISVIKEDKVHPVTETRVVSSRFQLHLVETKTTALHGLNVSRYSEEDGISTRPFGYKGKNGNHSQHKAYNDILHY